MPPMRSALYAGRDDTGPGGMSTSSSPESIHSCAKRDRVVLLGLGSVAGLSLLTALPGRALAAASEEAFIDALATMIEAKAVMAPTERFVFMQAYDAGRSNIQYIINQLQLQKKVNVLIRNSIDFCEDGDALEEAGEAGNRLTNTAIQLDSTVYTLVFIPGDAGEIPPSAEKYRKQCVTFYNAFNADIDLMLKLGSTEQLSKAQAISDANVLTLPPVLFKKV